MKNRKTKKKEGFTWEKLMTALTHPMLVLVILSLCFLIAIRTNHDNTSNGLLVALFALVMITYSAKTPIPDSNIASHEEKTSLSIGGGNGIDLNHEEKTEKQNKSA